MSLHLVFDVEAMGLHGEGWAVGAVVVDEDGNELASLYEAADARQLSARFDDAVWLAENCIPHCRQTLGTPRSVRNVFWLFWLEWKAKGASMWADCGWPVEARFLAACVDDEPGRWWEGPYPLHELATLIGTDTHERLPSELPAHHPLNDARQSARLLVAALKARREDSKWKGHYEAEREFVTHDLRPVKEAAEARVVVLESALRIAERELTWGDQEMRGRAPEHWVDGLASARAALAGAPSQAQCPPLGMKCLTCPEGKQACETVPTAAGPLPGKPCSRRDGDAARSADGWCVSCGHAAGLCTALPAQVVT
jgi:hypothetical protein